MNMIAGAILLVGALAFGPQSEFLDGVFTGIAAGLGVLLIVATLFAGD